MRGQKQKKKYKFKKPGQRNLRRDRVGESALNGEGVDLTCSI